MIAGVGDDEDGEATSRLAAVEAENERLRQELARLRRDSDRRTAERHLLRALIDQLPDHLYVKDTESRFIIANRSLAADFGRSGPETLIGRTDFDLHPPELAAAFRAAEQEMLRSGVPIEEREEAITDAAGRRQWLSTTKIPLRGKNGAIIGLAGIGRNITERKQADTLRLGQAEVLEMIARNAPLEEVLERLVRIIEAQLEGIRGSVLLLDEEGTHLHHGAAPNLPEAYCKAIDGLAIGPKAGSCGTAAYRRATVVVTDIATDPLWEDYRDIAAAHGFRSCWSTPILSPQGQVLGTFAMYSGTVRAPGAAETHLIDPTAHIAGIAIERKRAEDRIHYLAHHDALTGLPNRALLKDRLTQAMLYADRYDRWVTVAFLDLDLFKLVNDSLGHSTGDELLKVIAARMVKCVRDTDTVVRIGGDEFVILLANQPKSADLVTETLQAVRAAVAEPVHIGRHVLKVTCSMGLATYPDDTRDAETLLMIADAAMYRAKESGRDNFCFYTAEMNTRIHERLLLQSDLRGAVARGELTLLYQPQLDLATGRIFAVEALLRWNHPVRGTLAPGEFIPLAEESGLIRPIGDWVLETACRQNKAWQRAGLAPVTVCVNVSGRQFTDRGWINRVAAALADSGLAAEHLELELTESMLMQDADQTVATMEGLRRLGVSFSVDDFGTGYSSLSALKTFPVGRLKIDQSFIRDLATDESDRAITAAVISLGQKLKLKVIAEGVETEEQMRFLREAGCDEVQGFHVSPPRPAAEIAAILAGGAAAAATDAASARPR